MSWIPELPEFDKRQIVQKDWPKLMKWVKKIHLQKIYLVSTIPEKDDIHGVITLLTRQINGWELRSFDKSRLSIETEMVIRIPEQAASALALKLLPESYKLKQHHDKPGRPKKYTQADAWSVHIMRQKGVSIREIAKTKGMAVSTVQRLLASKNTEG